MEAAIRGGKWGKSSRSNWNSQPRQYLFHQRYPSVPQLHRPARRILRPGPGNSKHLGQTIDLLNKLLLDKLLNR